MGDGAGGEGGVMGQRVMCAACGRVVRTIRPVREVLHGTPLLVDAPQCLEQSRRTLHVCAYSALGPLRLQDE